MRIAIVGTGLSSWAVYNSLLSLHPTASITLLDGGKRFTDKSDSEFQTAEKGKFGSRHMYDTSGSGILFKERSNFSLAYGGLSTVWGAGIRLWSKKSLESIPVDIDSIYREARELLLSIPYSGGPDDINFPHRFSIESNPLPPGSKLFEAIKCDDSKTGVSVYRPALAVNVKGSEACRGCGECLTGCPYNSIFDSGAKFDSVINGGNTRHIVGIVESVMESNNQVTVTYTAENGVIRNQLDFEHVYLCAGAIGTPAILMRSGYLPNRIQVADSQVFYFMGLKLPKLASKHSFALSQATLVSEDSNPIQFSASLYLSNEQVRDRISKLVSQKLFGLRVKFPALIDRFLFLGIGFLDSRDSGQIVLDYSEFGTIDVSQLKNPVSKKIVNKAIKRISKRLRSSGLFVFPKIAMIPNPGAGFHSGAALSLGGKFTDKNGLLRGYERIHVADVSLLPYIKAGSHTITSMSINAAVMKAHVK